jgi:hypothetical protein
MRKGDDARQEGHIVSLNQPPPWSQEISGAMEEKRREEERSCLVAILLAVLAWLAVGCHSS